MPGKNMTTKLNESMRRKIMDRLFSKEEDRVRKARMEEDQRFADKLYEHQYGDVEKKMLSLPDGWLPKVDRVVFVSQSSSDVTLEMTKARPVPHCDFSYGSTYRINRHGHPLSSELTALHHSRKDEDEKQRQLRNKTLGTLRSFSTVNALMKGWPEIKKIIKDVCGEEPTTALAVPIAELNKALGLGREKEKVQC